MLTREQVHFCDRVAAVRAACDTYITELVGRAKEFNFVLWNRECVFTLLDTLEAVGRSCASPTGIAQTSVPLPDGRLFLNLPDSLNAREGISSVRARFAWTGQVPNKACGCSCW
jgi:hypothetical protein